jgi:hypothetical protein
MEKEIFALEKSPNCCHFFGLTFSPQSLPGPLKSSPNDRNSPIWSPRPKQKSAISPLPSVTKKVYKLRPEVWRCRTFYLDHPSSCSSSWITFSSKSQVTIPCRFYEQYRVALCLIPIFHLGAFSTFKV